MQFDDKRNVLRTGPPLHPGETEITPAMVETVRQRIKGAGGIITVWPVLNEDVYESQFGDGFYLHVSGIALDSAGAQRLADLTGVRNWRSGTSGATGEVWKTICRHSSHRGGRRKNSRSASS